MSNLDVAFVNLAGTRDSKRVTPRGADLTQMGDSRAGLAKTGHLLLPTSIFAHRVPLAVADVLGINVPTGRELSLWVDFADMKIAALTEDKLATVAASIAPAKEPDRRDVERHDRFNELAAAAAAVAPRDDAEVRRYLNGVDWNVQERRDAFNPLVVGNIVTSGDGKTWSIALPRAGMLPASMATELLACANSFPERHVAKLDRLLYVHFLGAGDDRYRLTAAYASAYDMVRQVILSRARSPAADIGAAITTADVNRFTECKGSAVDFAATDEKALRDSWIGVAGDAPGGINETNLAGDVRTDTAQLLYFAMCRGQLGAATQDVKDMFAEVRVLGMRRNLQFGTNEAVIIDGAVEVKLGDDIVAAWIAMCERPERAEVVLVGSLISFLECGHHCTAQNLGGKMESIARALGMQIPKSTWDTYVRPGCWAATHPFSVRLVYARYLALAGTGNLSYAITKRLNKNAPGTGSFILLGQVLDALNEAKFFELTDAQEEYKKARAAVSQIKKDNHLKAPYSMYMYGAVAAEDVAAKEFLTKLAPLAHSLGQTLPNSTIAGSEAFKRMTASAASNSITAGLQVRAFARVYGTRIEQDMTRRVQGVTGGQLRLTHTPD